MWYGASNRNDTRKAQEPERDGLRLETTPNLKRARHREHRRNWKAGLGSFPGSQGRRPSKPIFLAASRSRPTPSSDPIAFANEVEKISLV
jgi:hypothetical protein